MPHQTLKGKGDEMFQLWPPKPWLEAVGVSPEMDLPKQVEATTNS